MAYAEDMGYDGHNIPEHNPKEKRMAYNNNRSANKPPSRYVNSSSFVKNIIYEGPDGVPPDKEKVSLEPGITEEISFSLTAEKVQDFFAKLDAAVADPQGDGGLRITLYCSSKTNKETGEKFDGASISIVGKFPSKNNFKKGGSFSGGGSNRGGGNGRRDYPAQGNGGGSSSQGQQGARNSSENEHRGSTDAPNNRSSGPGNRPADSAQGKNEQYHGPLKGMNQGAANSGTAQSGQTARGTQTQDSSRGGHTQNAQNGASPSRDDFEDKHMGKPDSQKASSGEQDGPIKNDGYSQEPGW